MISSQFERTLESKTATKNAWHDMFGFCYNIQNGVDSNSSPNDQLYLYITYPRGPRRHNDALWQVRGFAYASMYDPGMSI